MEAFKVLELIKKYEDCPACKGATTFMVKDEVMNIECKCGLKLALNKDGEKTVPN